MLNRRAALEFVLVAPLAFNVAVASSRPRKPAAVARFPFELLANAAFFQAKLNGKGPYLFSLDTGSSNSVIASGAHF